MRPITAADLMNPKVLAVRDDLTLRELAAFLIRNQITGAPVEDAAGRLVGVVSTVDIAEAVLAGRGGGTAEEAGEEEEGEEDEEEEEEEQEEQEQQEEQEELGGLQLDDLRLARDDLLVRDIMTSSIHSVPEDATVSQVASRMLDGHVHRLLVTREGKPVGIITTSDLLGLLVDE